MCSSGPTGPPGSGLPPYDGNELVWPGRLPIRLEATARLLQEMAGLNASGPARPELLHPMLAEVDEEVTFDDVLELLLMLQELGFIRLFGPRGAERFAITSREARNMPETIGKGEGARGGAWAGARERATAPRGPDRPPGARAAPGRKPPRFCPEHMPRGTLGDCWACARTREIRAAWLEERRDALRAACDLDGEGDDHGPR